MRRTPLAFALLLFLPYPARAATLASASPGQEVGAKHTVSDLFGRSREIRFELGTAKLLESSLAFLDDLAAALLRESTVSLEIVSHTPSSGDVKKDLALSRRRAEAVKSVLVARGVGGERLLPVGRGSEDPIAPNLTRAGQARNDRVELHRASAPTH